MNLREAGKLLSGLHCPYCSNYRFNLKLRCDLGYDECISTARCRLCGHEFDIEDLIRHQHETLEETADE